ncbi:type-F conjugative transfer system pilin assembly thiol-disulfide isomerase TrbB [Budviciaceae bacterium BWR-B9]|uniref:Type-F conjugative transfer system pilin assembly thiol-disulfide isomerase TrbB n=1 Tax=Limnobaculum allomyrinae TaxID=2791986 RepID=A0ABS1IUX1_9GAMM|nr:MULTISPECIES: type-F conjugative transfer system pilin assembly thiol-disulfide isomerase TrbB [Limnobaculum]MBK5145538.1 type-F conjugative transfer system pilin assembly thiol-disulfide isomerase TrbB [Limnobaculum allomyrinae]MBV7693657.1 type-F conjugative transfer system pilin assembly thiol-disulfide isomerase TrbB [Limnobaculum sp. M2-1]
MKLITLIIGVLVGFCGQVSASTWDEIAAIEAAKLQRNTTNDSENRTATGLKTTPVDRWHTLSNGQKVNLNNWTVALFLQSTCSYCKQFDPILAQYSKEMGLSVSPFSLDGKGDESFPNVMLATPEVMVEFFSQGLPIATPTTYLVNVNSMATFPLLQGAVGLQELSSRIDEVFRFALSKGEK